jgi:hypothetical protein
VPHGTDEAEDRHSNFYDAWVNLGIVGTKVRDALVKGKSVAGIVVVLRLRRLAHDNRSHISKSLNLPAGGDRAEGRVDQLVALVAGITEVHEPLLVDRSRQPLEQSDPPAVVLDQVVDRAEDRDDSSLSCPIRKTNRNRSKNGLVRFDTKSRPLTFCQGDDGPVVHPGKRRLARPFLRQKIVNP